MSKYRRAAALTGLSFLALLAAWPAQAQTTCAPAWVATQVYVGGNTASQNSNNYRANWWTQGQSPATNNGGPGSGQPWTLVGPCGGGNTPPTVSITAPANNASFSAGANITISANASDSNGSVSNVVFRRSGIQIGNPDTTSPYSIVWSNVAAGTYDLTAVATDNQGASTTSPTVRITVGTTGCSAAPGVPTGVNSPSQTTTSFALSWTAVAPVPNCGANQYQVFVDNAARGGLVGGTSTTVSGLTPGTGYSVQVAAVNSFGSSARSGAINVSTQTGGGSCNGAPQYVAGTTYTAGQQVTNIGNLYRCVIAGWCSSSAAWAYAPGTGSAWDEAWDFVSPCGGGGTPPTVSLTAPNAGANFTCGASVTVSANAADSDGSVTRVEFFDGGASIGADTTSPYSVTWSASGNGSHSLTARATDNANNSTTSGARSVNVSGCGTGGGLGRHVITGYWHNFNNGSTVLRLSQVPANYHLIAVAFADATGTPGGVTFNLDTSTGYTSTAQFIADIDAINGQNGRKVIISVGGQNGTVQVNSSQSATNFANGIISLMNTYHFAGVDIDLENGLNAQFMEQALRSVVAAKPGAIITMAPQTIDMQNINAEYFKLARNLGNLLTIVNMQYYNSGTMLGCDGGVYSQGTVEFLTQLACIQLQNGLRPDQVGLGLPATGQAAGGGFVSPSVVNRALDCLAGGTNCGSVRPPRTWPGIRGAMTWSINWDATNGYNWVNTIAGHLNQVP